MLKFALGSYIHSIGGGFKVFFCKFQRDLVVR